MWLILIILVVVVTVFLLRQRKGTGLSEGSSREGPREILKRRYAAGEISKEEFERVKDEIES
jgi:putative membrane protein